MHANAPPYSGGTDLTCTYYRVQEDVHTRHVSTLHDIRTSGYHLKNLGAEPQPMSVALFDQGRLHPYDVVGLEVGESDACGGGRYALKAQKHIERGLGGDVSTAPSTIAVRLNSIP